MWQSADGFVQVLESVGIGPANDVSALSPFMGAGHAETDGLDAVSRRAGGQQNRIFGLAVCIWVCIGIGAVGNKSANVVSALSPFRGAGHAGTDELVVVSHQAGE